MLSTRAERTEFDKVLHAFIYSFLVYVCFSASRGTFPISLRVDSTAAGVQHFVIEPHVWPLVELALIATALGVLFAIALNHDFPLSVLRRKQVTQRTFRISVWSDTFHSFRGYVQVELADGRNIIGWLRFYSDTAEESSLFLEDAAWLRSDGKQFAIDGSGILLTKESGIRNILFLKAVENCEAGEDFSILHLGS